jgi:serine/threonine protein kinase/tetratricopeptide (TPR) repeat protein
MPLAVTTAVLTPPPQTVVALTQASQTPVDEAPTDGATIVSTAPRSATGPLQVGQAFGSRYHIIRVLGVGGMGAVYHAWDAELGMAVALKVIRPETSIDPVTAQEMERRFKQELVLARQVTHKNVVRIHDLGEIGGIKYITMPYLDGSDLATKLKERSKLPVPEALSIARDVAAGLAAAHDAGIVHRDLKPANIMILSDDAVIMDFGIARSAGNVSAATAPSLSPLTGMAAWQTQGAVTTATVAGAILGTVHYMAPEQARGEVVDQRADIYAFGLIFSDMLLGVRRSENAVAELKQRMAAAPSPVRAADPSIPAAVETLIGRCLEPDAAARFQTSAELVAALDALDEQGEPIPIKRVVRLPVMVGIVAVLLVASGGIWWYQRSLIPPAPHDPVSVVIADFQNGTNDPAFDRVVEPMLRRALEGASFITAYDRSGVSTLGTQLPPKLDEGAAREIAAKQGLGVVVSGSIQRQGSGGFVVAIKAAETVTGKVIANASNSASTKDEVLSAATQLAARVRTALGDDTSDSAQLFAMTSLSATSLGVLSQYAAGREAAASGKFEEARDSYLKAIQLDPNFGIGYQALGTLSLNIGNVEEADRYFKEALRHLDGMTERERFTTRGMYYRIIGNYPQCVKEYSDLIARYAADVLARNNLALCSTFLRDLPKAVTEMRQLVQIMPKRALYRLNLALYASYAGDFAAGEKEARAAQDLGSAFSWVPLAFAQLGQGQLTQTLDTYQQLAKASSLGRTATSYAASGVGDLAAYQGRFSDAARVFGEGAAADMSAKSGDRAAAKFASMAYALLSRGQKAAAAAAALKAVASSNTVKIRFLAARTLVEADQIGKATPLISALAAETLAEPQAYAKIVQGDVFLKNGAHAQAIKSMSDANQLLDTWIGRFDLGRAYLAAGEFLQADSEFDRCIKRRGEALSLFLDEEPTSAYLPPVYYYQGRVREELKTRGFAQSYLAYLNIRGMSSEDPLVADARRRADAEP